MTGDPIIDTALGLLLPPDPAEEALMPQMRRLTAQAWADRRLDHLPARDEEFARAMARIELSFQRSAKRCATIMRDAA